MKSLKNRLKSLPKKPGVYIFKNAKGSILYVGKAKNLKSRVASYFQKSNSLEASKRLMVTQIADLEYIIVDSETEALFLETTLIKRHHPPYNIIMRDDKYFIYIKINLAEDFPSVSLVRRIVKDQARYFGPYQSAKIVRLTLKHLKKIFPIKTCKNKPEDPCFDFRLHRCAGHLTSPASRSEYQAIIKNFIHFLEGRSEGVLVELRRSMSEASKQQHFEKAAEARDRITAIERVLERQKVILQTNNNLDLISLVRERALAGINLFAFREGKLISRKNFILKNIQDEKNPFLLASFVEQYYTQSTEHPKQVIFRELPDRREEIEKLLQLKFKTAERGKLFQLLKLGEANARDALAKSRVEDEASQTQLDQALADLAKFLHLAEPPRRIETYDISNIQGVNAVGSMVVFEAGLPKKSDYRKFKIKTVSGANDPAMLAEILQRRFGHLAEASPATWPKPDLILLDGGKGQLNIVRGVLAKLNGVRGVPAEHRFSIPLAALAKRNEELFLPGKKNPILLPPDSPALFLVQRMRDEAHRFAIGFYRKTHRRQSIKSQLDEIPGLGPKTKKKLLQKFGSIKGIRQATDQELTKLVGSRLTEAIRDSLGS
ncbi:MAG: excinuclease ABC subunit UvrC [Patescibacteria group bacterium]|nr:excinuclease ABC subunit UvrC [Patescibacteria group bacterium]